MEHFTLGNSILAMGRYISWVLIIGFLGRVALTALGLMSFQLLLYLGLEPREMFKTLNIVSGDIMDAGEAAHMKLVWLFLGVFAVHFALVFGVSYKSFFKNLDGDEVARDMFIEVNDAFVPEHKS